MTIIMKTKTDLTKWNGKSVSDIATVIKEVGKVQKTDIAAEYRAPFFLRTHPAKLVAMDEDKKLISSDGKTIISMTSANWEMTHVDLIAEHVETLYPEETLKKGIAFRTGLLKSGKLAYLDMGVEVFSTLESTNKSSLPGDRTATTLNLYVDGNKLFEARECETLIKAIDEMMFEMVFMSIQDD